MKSLILFSGGTDSTTCLALAKSRGEEVVCVSLTYGQKHAEPELAAAETIAGHYGVPWHLLDVSNIFFASESSLTRADRKIPEGPYQPNPDTEVEFRNGVFLSVMASLALQFHADKIYYGAHEDATGVIYADCSREFIDAAKELIRIGTGGRVELVTPFAGQTKAKVIETGLRLQVPYELTYSCYSGTVPPCGHCGTCIDRKEAFLKNGIRE